MTRDELQRLYDRYIEAEATDIIGVRVIPAKRALVDGVRDLLAESDPTVEIAYLRAKLADVKAGNGRLLGTEAAATARVVELSQQVHAREAAIKRVLALTFAHDGGEWPHDQFHDGGEEFCPGCWADDIRRAIKSGDQHA